MVLPAFEDWPRPWKSGELDEDKVARLVYNLKTEVEGHKTKVAEKDAEIATLTTDLDTAKASKSGTDEDAQNTIKDLTKKVRDLEAAQGKARPEDELTIARLKVGMKLGLDPEDAERLQGKDYDEILADGKGFAERHGLEVDDEEDENGGGNGGGGYEGGYPGVQPVSSFGTGRGRRQPTVRPDPEGAKTNLPPLR